MNELPLANGIVIDTRTGQAIAPSLHDNAVKQQENNDAHRSRQTSTAARNGVRDGKERVAERGRDRSNRAVRTPIAELPADPRAITTVGVVWLYFTLGLSDFDIRDATGLTLPQIESIKGLSLFDTIGDRVGHNLAELGREDIRSRIERMANRSVDVIEAVIDDNEVEASVKLRAAQDLLDRAGHSAKQIIEHNHKLEGGLVIKHVRSVEMDSSQLPRIHIDRDGASDA